MAKNSLSTLTVSLSALLPLMSKVLRSQQIQPDGPLISPSWQHALISEMRLLPLTSSLPLPDSLSHAGLRQRGGCAGLRFSSTVASQVSESAARRLTGEAPRRRGSVRGGEAERRFDGRVPCKRRCFQRDVTFFLGFYNPADASCRSRLSVLLHLRLNTITFQVCPFIAFGYSNHTQ